MNKKLKVIIEFLKVHKKESIGVAVAVGIAVVGIGGYVINSHYSKNNIEKNNIALAEKKEDTTKADENKELDKENQGETTESDVVVEEKEDGTLIVKDKEGNIVADSSKGDDVTKIVADKKEAGGNVAIKDKDGKVEKVEKVENGSITVTGCGTVTVKPPIITENTKPNEPSKPNNSTGGTESNSKPSTNNENNNNPAPPVENNKPVEKPNNDNSTNTKPQDKPVETPKPTPPTENKPVEKPQEPVKPVRTWEYQAGMSNELWSLFNQYRQENGLNVLNWSGKYATWTKQHAEEMAQKEDAYHKGYPEGGQVTGLDGSKNMTASKILQGFKNSPQHNKNLLDDELTEGACAVYKDSNGVYYFVIGFDY